MTWFESQNPNVNKQIYTKYTIFGSHFEFILLKLPLNSDHLSTTATIFGSHRWSLYTGLIVHVAELELQVSNVLIESSSQPAVRLKGFLCPNCNFKSTHKSYYDEHIKSGHNSDEHFKSSHNSDESKTEDENKNETRTTTVFTFPSQKVVTFPVTQNPEAVGGQTLTLVQKPRYFCCYCGLEQFETERLLKHISVVHLKW